MPGCWPFPRAHHVAPNPCVPKTNKHCIPFYHVQCIIIMYHVLSPTILDRVSCTITHKHVKSYVIFVLNVPSVRSSPLTSVLNELSPPRGHMKDTEDPSSRKGPRNPAAPWRQKRTLITAAFWRQKRSTKTDKTLYDFRFLFEIQPFLVNL